MQQHARLCGPSEFYDTLIFRKQIIQLYVLGINTTNYRGGSFTLLIKGYIDYLYYSDLVTLLILCIGHSTNNR